MRSKRNLSFAFLPSGIRVRPCRRSCINTDYSFPGTRSPLAYIATEGGGFRELGAIRSNNSICGYTLARVSVRIHFCLRHTICDRVPIGRIAVLLSSFNLNQSAQSHCSSRTKICAQSRFSVSASTPPSRFELDLIAHIGYRYHRSGRQSPHL